MSISTQQREFPDLKRETAIPKASIKRITESTAKFFGIDPVNPMLIIFSFLTGIGELLGANMSWKWYVVFSLVIIIFALDKFDILKKEEVIIQGESSIKIDQEI